MLKFDEYYLLKEHADQAIENGDIEAAHSALNAIVDLIDKEFLPASFAARHKYELALTCMILQKERLARTYIRELMEDLSSSRRKDDRWILDESKNVLAFLDDFEKDNIVSAECHIVAI